MRSLRSAARRRPAIWRPLSDEHRFVSRNEVRSGGPRFPDPQPCPHAPPNRHSCRLEARYSWQDQARKRSPNVNASRRNARNAERRTSDARRARPSRKPVRRLPRLASTTRPNRVQGSPLGFRTVHETAIHIEPLSRRHAPAVDELINSPHRGHPDQTPPV